MVSSGEAQAPPTPRKGLILHMPRPGSCLLREAIPDSYTDTPYYRHDFYPFRTTIIPVQLIWTELNILLIEHWKWSRSCIRI